MTPPIDAQLAPSSSSQPMTPPIDAQLAPTSSSHPMTSPIDAQPAPSASSQPMTLPIDAQLAPSSSSHPMTPPIDAQLAPSSSSQPMPAGRAPSRVPPGARGRAHVNRDPQKESSRSVRVLRSSRSTRRPDDRAMEQKKARRGLFLLRGGGAGNRTLVREASTVPSFTCVVAASPATGFADSAATYLSLSSFALSRAPSRDAALVVNAFGIPGRSLRRTAQRFSGRESECVIVVRTYNGPLDERIGRRHTQIRSQSPRRSRSPPWV